MAGTDNIPLEVLACDLTVFAPGEGAEHARLLGLVRGATLAREELEDGWRFILTPDGFAAAAGWAGYERRCCEFFDFRLEWPSQGPPTLTVTGPPCTKELLSAW